MGSERSRSSKSTRRGRLLRAAALVGAAGVLMAGGCHLVGGIDDERGIDPGASSGGAGAASTNGGGGTGGTTTAGGGGQGGDPCGGALPQCDDAPPPIEQEPWPDSSPYCYGGQPTCQPGEDGDRLGPRSYVDTSNGTVIDQLTGLVWQKEASPTAINHQAAEDYCAGLPLDGSGWRLPSYLEMLSLVDYGRESLLPAEMAINWTGAGLFGGPGLWVREASNLPQATQWHYYFMFEFHEDLGASFRGGEATWGGSGILRFARCVSGDSLTVSPTLETCCDPSIVRDSRTGLAWQAVPSDDPQTWEQAKSHCIGLPDHGGGWRLPSVKELGTLFKPDSIRNVVPPVPPFDALAQAVFWSSTPSVKQNNRAFVIDFLPDNAYFFPIRPGFVDDPYRAWCVRSYQP